jgi:glycosyltransferase involved in cell wall biosynthesis
MPVRADLHLHSRFSDRSAEWILRRFDFPDSVSDPRALYQELRKKGMKFVTLTDHDTIAGCLEIASLPGTFVSEQVTTFFPEDRCPVHLLVWGIDERIHHDIQEIRENVFDLQSYLAQHEIAHAVAHPLYRLHPSFGRGHFEKLILLFKHFEGINGLRNGTLSETAGFILRNLTPETIAHLQETHGIEATHPEPWIKILTGGSDDHGGVFPGSAWTETPDCGTPEQFLSQIRAGNCTAAGTPGTPLTVSHGLYNTLYFFGKQRLAIKGGPTTDFLEKAFSRFMEGKDPTRFSFGEKLSFLAQGIASGKIFELANPRKASLWKDLAEYLGDSGVKSMLARETEGIAEPERRAFLIANLLAHQLAFRFFTKFVRELNKGDLFESVQTVSALAPLVLLLGPYLYAFQSQGAPVQWLQELSDSLAHSRPPSLTRDRRAWFTDTLEDVNGVATTIKKMTAAAVEAGADLTIVTCRSSISSNNLPIKNFTPIGEFELPEYELQKLSFPPILQILDYIQREGFTEVIISTPGPLGLTALLGAKMFGLKASGIYHTDFPQYVRFLTDDNFLETLTWNFMHWFYSQLDMTYVNSEQYRQCWIERGIAASKLRILPRGLDLKLFDPSRRNADFWVRRGKAPGEVGVLYVGRVSREKNIDVLERAYSLLRKKGIPVRLLVVGDGPYLSQLREQCPEAIVTGALSGVELATAYASADLFAFPSTTDTFGNVILEAMAARVISLRHSTQSHSPRALKKSPPHRLSSLG